MDVVIVLFPRGESLMSSADLRILASWLVLVAINAKKHQVKEMTAMYLWILESPASCARH